MRNRFRENLLLSTVAGAVMMAVGCTPADRSTTSAGVTASQDAEFVSPSTTAAYAGDLPPAAWPRSRVESAIEKALAERVTVWSFETPLSNTLAVFRDDYELNIVIDRDGMEDYGLENDPRIMADLTDVTLASALTLILEPHGLGWGLRDEVLVITAEEEAETLLVTRVYDVADLVACVDEEGQTWYDFDTLIDLIACTVAMDTWDEVGGDGAIRGATLGGGSVLVVSQTYPIQLEVGALLGKLHAATGDGSPPVRRRLL